MSEFVHVDPVKLRAFAEELSATLAYYKRAIEVLEARLASLGRSWRDEQFVQFSREVLTTRRILEEFLEEGKAARIRLLEDAERAEAYQRINVV